MLMGDREVELLKHLYRIAVALERSNEQQNKMVQALERLASAFQDSEDGNGAGPVPPLRS